VNVSTSLLSAPSGGLTSRRGYDDSPLAPLAAALEGASARPARRIGDRRLEQADQAAKAAARAEEAALLARIRDRDERAVEELYARYSGPLYSLAYQVTRSDRFAQDVVQEVFIAVWKDAGRFDPTRGALGPWLFSLARHKAIDLVRRESTIRKRTADVDLAFEEAPDNVDQEAWLRVRRERVRAAIAELPENQRTALELAFFAGLTHVEVAERLDIPLGTAKTRIRTALLKLREIIGTSLAETEPTDSRWITEASGS
jgi:RNA polymerase sigma factor (sigma-70 family)